MTVYILFVYTYLKKLTVVKILIDQICVLVIDYDWPTKYINIGRSIIDHLSNNQSMTDIFFKRTVIFFNLIKFGTK